jgi:hypothetical protein
MEPLRAAGKVIGRTREKLLPWAGFSYLGNCVGAVGADSTLAETQRNLETALAFVSNGVSQTRLPPDTILVGLSIRLSGTVTYTFASGPAATQVGTLDDLVSLIEVSTRSGTVIKSVQPKMVHMQQLLNSAIQGERKASAAAAAAYNNNPTVDGGFTFGTTTQTTTVAETVYVPFEMILAKVGRDTTWLNIKGQSQADLRMYFKSISSLDLTGNATFTAFSLSFEINTVEARDYSPTKERDWKQTTQVIPLTAQVSDFVIRLNAGNRMCGLSFFVQDNIGAVTATGNRPNNNTLTTIKLRRNGREFYRTTFQTLQSQNKARFGVNTPFSSNKSRMDGFAYLDFLQHRVLDTALELRFEKGITTFDLLVTTLANDATNNIYPCQLVVEQGELVNVKGY